ADLVGHLRRVRAAIPDVPVTTADIYPTFPNSPAITQELDVLFYNAYPYWEGIDIDEAVAYFESCHERVVAVADGRPVWVSETGWPTAGATVGRAEASLDNQRRSLEGFRAWARANDVPYFWFASFDEGWKASTQEGAQGAHWGLWDEEGVLKADYFGSGR
ncbi:MAG: glycosyl hydrolase family 17 protein, partial [Myxococcota bacterium]